MSFIRRVGICLIGAAFVAFYALAGFQAATSTTVTVNPPPRAAGRRAPPRHAFDFHPAGRVPGGRTRTGC